MMKTPTRLNRVLCMIKLINNGLEKAKKPGTRYLRESSSSSPAPSLPRTSSTRLHAGAMVWGLEMDVGMGKALELGGGSVVRKEISPELLVLGPSIHLTTTKINK